MVRQNRCLNTFCILNGKAERVVNICFDIRPITLGLTLFMFILLLCFSSIPKYQELIIARLSAYSEAKLINEQQKKALGMIEQNIQALNQQMYEVHKEREYLQSLLHTSGDLDQTNAFVPTGYSEQPKIEKTLLGDRIERNSVVIENTTLLEFYEDTEAGTANAISGEERALLAVKQIRHILGSKFNFNIVKVRAMGEDLYIGQWRGNIIFRVDKNDSKLMNATPEELASGWASNINKQLALINKNRKRLTAHNFLASPFTGNLKLSKELEFLAKKTTFEQVAHAELKKAAEQIGLNYAYTPSNYPLDRPISSTFGLRPHPVTHSLRFHSGLDFWAWPGTQVHATASGRVVYSGWQGGYGYIVILYHGK